MSRAASKNEVQDLHRTLARRLKTMLGSEDHNSSAAFLQVCRQFVRDQNVRTELVANEASAEELADQLEELENTEFPSEFPN